MPNRPPPSVGDDLTMPIIASFTLGLAPFFPEPHIIGKIRWVAGGAEGMAPVDWMDLLMHGAPWVWLAAMLVKVGMDRLGRAPQPEG